MKWNFYFFLMSNKPSIALNCYCPFLMEGWVYIVYGRLLGPQKLSSTIWKQASLGTHDKTSIPVKRLKPVKCFSERGQKYSAKLELEECIPLPIWTFLAPPNRKTMGQSGLLMMFLYPDYEENEAENQKGSKLHRSAYCWIFSE